MGLGTISRLASYRDQGHMIFAKGLINIRRAYLGKVVGKGSVDGDRNSVVLKRVGGIIELVIEERRK